MTEKKTLLIIDSRDEMKYGGPATVMRCNLDKIDPGILNSYNLVDSKGRNYSSKKEAIKRPEIDTASVDFEKALS